METSKHLFINTERHTILISQKPDTSIAEVTFFPGLEDGRIEATTKKIPKDGYVSHKQVVAMMPVSALSLSPEDELALLGSAVFMMYLQDSQR